MRWKSNLQGYTLSSLVAMNLSRKIGMTNELQTFQDQKKPKERNLSMETKRESKSSWIRIFNETYFRGHDQSTATWIDRYIPSHETDVLKFIMQFSVFLVA